MAATQSLSAIQVDVIASVSPENRPSVDVGNPITRPGNIQLVQNAAATSNLNPQPVNDPQPNIYKSISTVSTGSTALWTPTAGKRFQLMWFRILITANAATAGGAVIVVDLLDSAATLNLTHSVFVATAAATTMPGAFDSGIVKLGSGILSAAINNVLNLNLSAALSAGACRVIAAGVEI